MQGSDSGGSKFPRQSPSRNVKFSDSKSPGSLQNLNSPNHQYLPGFLMGDLRTYKDGCISPLLKSPNQSSDDIHQAKSTLPRVSGINTPSYERVRRNASPPTQSLWSSANQEKKHCKENITPENGNSVHQNLNASNCCLTPSRPELTSIKHSSTFFSPLQMNPLDFSRKESDDEASTWVTVFGYDQAQANSVLQHFSHVGTIEKYIITNGGNWMNIKYANKIQARCALNRNGRVLDGKIMIGVRKCTDLGALSSADVISSTNQNIITDESDSSDFREAQSNVMNNRRVCYNPSDSFSPAPNFGFPIVGESMRNGAVKLECSGVFNQSFSGRGDSFGGPIRNGLSRHSSMRPLAAPYQPPPRCQVTRANQFQTFKSGNSKSSGLLSKALDYVFGWN